ncbi:hypothetical protein TWF106_005128 [Orbilia oligospora]|uniref:Vacuolar import and degradation protein 21 n=1 Tax=Orbilia oligospora TaxID=2813651 RepID=A0A6G1MCA9_ORBOL|nr:hypothetical protein TWF106_005128 [Orbilia oligospora]KAF3253585.1 hypothetical protein TWF192_003837 [Orbilia oligospora]
MASTETLIRLTKKREALDKLVSNRKRKLQELYRVVNHVQVSCATPRRPGGSSSKLSSYDEEGERKFLESTDINLSVLSPFTYDSKSGITDVDYINRGKAFNANEMLPKPILVVPDIIREALKPIISSTAQNGDPVAVQVVPSKIDKQPPPKDLSSTDIRQSDNLAIPRSNGATSRATTPKLSNDADESGVKTPVRRSVKQNQEEPPPFSTPTSVSVTENARSKEPSGHSSGFTENGVSMDIVPVSQIPDESIEVVGPRASSAQAPISQPRAKSPTPPPLERTTSQKSEQPNLAISTQATRSPQDHIPRPFPTPTTATETEHSILPPTSAPRKSITPPSPAESVSAPDAIPDELPHEPSSDAIFDDAASQVDGAEEMSEVDPDSAKEMDVSDQIALAAESSVEKPSSDEVMGEVEKQLQVETALSKQQDEVPLVKKVENSQIEPSSGPLATEIQVQGHDLSADAEMVDVPEEVHAVLSQPAKLELASEEPSTTESPTIKPKTSSIEGPIPGAEMVSEGIKMAINEQDNEAKHNLQDSPQSPILPIKREEKTPFESLEPSSATSMGFGASAIPGFPQTPQNLPHDHDTVENSAIAETPMSVDEAGTHFNSPKATQPLTTAALESINTTVSTPATRASSSRREKRPSVSGGLQLAKIVFHGRSTAATSNSRTEASNELSPSAAPVPPRVGTRSGSISTPARMNSRSLEAQRISSLAELREQHQAQIRQQVANSRKRDDKSRLDVFDYLTAVTASEPLQNSLATSHKTLSTAAFQLLRREKQAIQALTEIQDLQKAGKWSLTQPARAIEPPKQMVHRDYLLMEVKWMSKDFKEDRKWNLVKSKKLADACVAWHIATPEQRKAMCIRTTRDTVPSRNRHVTQVPTPDLMPSDEHSDDDDAMRDDDDGDDHMRDDFVHRLHEVENPGNLFALGTDDIIFEILHNSMTDRMLGELPTFEAPKVTDVKGQPIFFDGWKNNEPLGPGAGLKRTLWEAPVEEGPPNKKSRFSYDPEYKLLDSDDEDDDNKELVRRAPGSAKGVTRSGSPVLQPQNSCVALFNPDFQPVLQRLHNAHPFRPPQEMPPATFFEYRSPSQWTAEEDKELVAAVRKYNHNWWLVSQVMQPKSFLQSGADRRSLWECFERWFMLDPQNQELIKGPFFKPVQQRLDLAARAPTHANAAAQQAAAAAAVASTPGGSSTAVTTPGQPPKRRTSQPMRVERKRNTRTLNMIEQMRKLAKKREVQASKQAQSANIAIKKQQEQSAQQATAPKSEQYTPAQVSRMKHEREVLHRQQAQMAQMAQIQRRQAQAAAASQQQQPSQSGTTATATTAAAASASATATATATASTTAAATPGATTATTATTNGQTANNVPVQSRSSLQVSGMQVSGMQVNPAAGVPTTAQQSLLAAQQQRTLMAAASNTAAIQAATHQVNQHLRAQGHTVSRDGQNSPTSLTPEQYRMLIQARMQANAVKLQQANLSQVQAQAQAAAHGGNSQVTSATASHIHAMQQAVAAARAHNNTTQNGQTSGASATANTPAGNSVISAQQAMLRIKQHFPTIGDEYVQRMILQHQAQAKSLGRELTYTHISNLIANLAQQYQGATAQAQAAQQAAHAQQQVQQAQQQQQQHAAANAATATVHHQAGHNQSPPHHAVVGVSHVGAGGIHHPHPPISRAGGSASTQQMLNQLMMSQTRAPSSSPMMGNATPVMNNAGIASRGSSATPMQRGGSYHTPTPGPNGATSVGMQQGSPRVGQSQMGAGSG